jgi:hypothetical protein
MLNIIISIDELQSSFTGAITLHLNTGGVRKAVIEEERCLKFIKADSVKPHIGILISQQRST